MRIFAAVSLALCIALSAVPLSAAAAVYTVGNDADGSCTHAAIQAALDAAASTPEADEVRISKAVEYSGPLRVERGDVVIAGGYAGCSAISPSGLSVIRGTTGETFPVLAIDLGPCTAPVPPSMRVEGLELTLGSHQGVYVGGCIDLELARLHIHGNSASYGAGLAISGSGAANTRVTLGDAVRIDDNVAVQGGGGIYAYAASLRIDGAGTVVRANRVTAAEGFGGGIALFGGDASLPARASLVSSGEGGDGVVSHNAAAQGAGLHAGGHVIVEAYTGDRERPVRFDSNSAAPNGRGGAIRLAGPDAHMLVVEGVIEANLAATGAAVALDGGAHFLMQALPQSHPADAVACVPATACNRISNHIATSGSGRGLVVAASGGAPAAPTSARLASVRIVGNAGDSLFNENCSGSSCPPLEFEVVNSLIAGNATRNVLDAPGVASFECDLCTLTGPSASTQPVFRTAGGLSLSRSVIWEPGRAVIGGLVPEYLNAIALQLHERSAFAPVDFPLESDIRVGDPRFASPMAGDYRPTADSPLLDRTWDSVTIRLDAGGSPRAIDQAGVPDLGGPVDVGAFERGPDDVLDERLYVDGFDAVADRD